MRSGPTALSGQVKRALVGVFLLFACVANAQYHLASDGWFTANQQAGSGGGGGTGISDFFATVPAALLTVSPSHITAGGQTLAIDLHTQAANCVFAGPTSGGAVAPACRALVAADFGTTLSPTFNAVTVTTLNKVTITQPATGSTLTIPDGETLNAGAGGTLGSLAFQSVTLPAGSIVGTTDTQTLTNKSIVATQLTGTLQAAQEPAHVGDMTNTAGSLTTAVGQVHPNLASVNHAASPYAVAAADSWIRCDASGGAVTVNLPAATGSKRYVNFKNIGASGTCSIAPNGTDTIDGVNAALSSTVQYGNHWLYDAASGAWDTGHRIAVGGDLSGLSSAAVVGKINGTSLAGLGTGLLKNTTGTGVPSIAVAADVPVIPLSTGVSGTLAAAQEPAHTGDTTNSAGSLAMTTGKVNGVAFSASPSNHTVPIITASNTATYSAINDCNGAGKALTYTQSGDSFGCNTISGGSSPTGTGAVTVTSGVQDSAAKGYSSTGTASNLVAMEFELEAGGSTN